MTAERSEDARYQRGVDLLLDAIPMEQAIAFQEFSDGDIDERELRERLR